MKVKRILCIVLTFAAVCSLALTRDSLAWFKTTEGMVVSATLEIRTVDYDFAGTLGSFYRSEAVAGSREWLIFDQNLILDNGGKITGVNHSTAATQIRFQVVYDKPNGSSTTSVTYNPSDQNDLVVTVPNGWTYSDGYFSRDFSAEQSGGSTSFDIITGISYSGPNVTRANYFANGNVFSGKVTVTIQAKQAGIASWTDIWSTSTP